MNSTDETLAHELLIKEEQLIRVSARVIYGAGVALVAAAVWLTTIQISAAQTRKEFDDHVRGGVEYRSLNDKRWLRINNALIRLQQRQGVAIPPSELVDDLDE